MQSRLEARVADEPENASNWRLLGKWKLKQNDLTGAKQALETSQRLDPQSAATQFNLATLWEALGNVNAAADHAVETIEIAPESSYAAEARGLLARINRTLPQPDLFQGEVSEPVGSVVQAGYEITRFDGSALSDDAEEMVPEALPPASPWRVRVETGAVYNSNVTLSPVNRELYPGKRDSAQFFAAPELEYRAFSTDDWAIGSTFLGHFTFNEDSFRNLNLQSYQPGAFLERVFAATPNVHVARLQYGFAHDEFGGKTLGNRHTIMASAATVWESQDLTFCYFSTDYTSISGDGPVFSVTGRDGLTYRAGAAHTFACDQAFLKSIRFGVDGEHADLNGSNYRYQGVSLYTALEMPITEKLKFDLEGGWGYRDYFDFDTSSSPSRNENIWRAGCRLTHQLNNHWSLAGVFNYDRFDSENPLFASDRYLTGLVLIAEY
tara:strand:- start:131724 stop:133034 length:1311 start_codon:yes stop_codon:yes gene_type:complete